MILDETTLRSNLTNSNADPYDMGRAFWNEEAVGKILHPKRDEYPGDIIKHWRMKNRQDWFDWSHFPLVAEDENGRIVGFADWSRESKQLAWFDPRRCIAFDISGGVQLRLWRMPLCKYRVRQSNMYHQVASYN